MHLQKRETLSTESVYQATDPGSGLDCSMNLQRGEDGGLAAIGLELRNPSEVRDVLLKANREISAFIMLAATNDQGTVLSKPARKFDTSESQQFDFVRIGRDSAHEWCVPLATQLDPGRLPEQGIQGRLVVNIALLYQTLSGTSQPAADDFSLSMLTLYDMDVLFTPSALTNQPPTR